MSLKEKAKTLVQIIRENCIELYISRCKFCIGECQFEGTKSFAGNWVRLEDAQKEIDHLSEQRNIEYTIRNSLQRERLELKQKLLGLLNEYPSNDGIDVPYDDEIRVTRLIQWKQKLERFINGL